MPHGDAVVPALNRYLAAFAARDLAVFATRDWHDVITLENDRQPGEPLIRPVMRAGERQTPPETLDDIRRRAVAELERLPALLHRLDEAPPYPIVVAPALRELAAAVDREKPASD